MFGMLWPFLCVTLYEYRIKLSSYSVHFRRAVNVFVTLVKAIFNKFPLLKLVPILPAELHLINVLYF